MKIAVLTYGTRGDVQPYAVLGQYLAQRGHDVTIAACTNVAGMTRQAGLDTVPIPIDSRAAWACGR
jgi:sterol 3beta-glucosyltransferase